jgi:hypothetical protein
MKKRWFLTSAALASALCATTALSAEIDLPARKPGAWNIQVVTKAPAGMPPMMMQVCLDAATDQAIMERSLAMSADCDMTQARDGDTLTIDATCQRDGRTLKSHSVISGDFKSSYTIAVTGEATQTVPGQTKHTEITQQAQWVGACPADMKAGEAKLPSGRVVNLLDAIPKPAR